MTGDRRLTPANARVAAAELRGKLEARRYLEGSWHRVAVPVADLLRRPDGPRDRQLLFGTRVRVFERRHGHAFVQSARDGYVGYLAESVLGGDGAPTHSVRAPATHLYPAPDMKRAEICGLSHGALLTIRSAEGPFLETDGGHFVPACHVAPVGSAERDPVTVAELYLGTPYLWGGNSRAGIDCSGLVQAALLACGIPCPGDSDMQEAALGRPLPDEERLLRGDLVFWPGHVGLVADQATLLHANAHHMAVVREPLETALRRIAATATGKPTSRRRLA